MHLLAETDTRKSDGKQQVAGDAEAFGINVVNRVEVVGNLFGEITGLLAGKGDFTLSIAVILI